MTLMPIYKRIYDVVVNAHKVFVVSHPECGDALGSTLALVHWLDSLGKDYVAYSNKPVPQFLDFLPKSFEIVTDASRINLADFDVVIIVDSNYYMTGISDKLKTEIDYHSTVVINIDHHITNNGKEGEVVALDTKASSTTRMLYDFFISNNINISRDIATCLLVGILFDTGNFSNSATDEKALATSARLLSKGAPIGMIINALINDKTIDLLKLWGKILSRLTLDNKTGIVFTIILDSDVNGCNCDSGTGKIANFLNNVDEGQFVMILKEDVDAGLVKCSLRTTQANVDVSRFAQFFGGGGHVKASGFALPGRLVYNELTKSYSIE